MKPRPHRETGQTDLFRPRLDQIINPADEVVRLGRQIDWGFIEAKCGEAYSDVPGQPPLPTRLMAGLAILKHTFGLSDEALCARFLDSPHFQYFCGEEFFRHDLPFDRSSLTRWRQRMGEDRLNAFIQESLSVAVKTKAMRLSDLTEAVVDTTVQEKAVAFPTDAKLCNRARERLVRLARRHGVRLRQSYARVGKLALIKHQRYAHAKQFKRAKRSLRTLKTYLGRVMRDIERAITQKPALNAVFRRELYLAGRVLAQKRGERGRKVYSLHAPEVECIGGANVYRERQALTNGKAHKPYESGVKVSVATPVRRSPGGQFVLHAKALPGNPYDGHTLSSVIPAIEQTTGAVLSRILADDGYRGHNAPASHKFRVYTSSQKRRVTPAIKKLKRRRAAIEPVIGHMKQDHRLGRNFLAHSTGDAINAVLAAAGYNFRRILSWLRLLLAWIIYTLSASKPLQAA
jgi:transposase, IS5 family